MIFREALQLVTNFLPADTIHNLEKIDSYFMQVFIGLSVLINS